MSIDINRVINEKANLFLLNVFSAQCHTKFTNIYKGK